MVMPAQHGGMLDSMSKHWVKQKTLSDLKRMAEINIPKALHCIACVYAFIYEERERERDPKRRRYAYQTPPGGAPSLRCGLSLASLATSLRGPLCSAKRPRWP